MKPIDTLLGFLQDVINNQEFKRNQIQDMVITFAKKGFPSGRINQLLGGNYQVSMLDEDELLAFTIVMYEQTMNEDINPNEYFYEKAIEQMKSIEVVENRPTEIRFKTMEHPTKEEYTGYMDLYNLVELYSNGLLSYNIQTQRQPKYRKTKNGQLLIRPDLNKKAVEKIAELMYENKFESNMVTFNVRKIDGKKQNMYYDKSTGEIVIQVDYDKDSQNETYLDCLDGWHRENGAIIAVKQAKEANKILTGQLLVCIKHLNQVEARAFVAREFEQNKTNDAWIKALQEEDKIVSIIRNINDYGNEITNMLKNKIGETDKEVQFLGKYTTVDIIKEAFKVSGFKFTGNYTINKNIKVIVNVISQLLGYIIYHKFNEDIENAKKSIYFHPRVFIGYIAIAELLQDKQNIENIDEDMLSIIVDSIDTINSKDLDLETKNIHAKKIYQQFINTINEFIQ